jgi:ubiquinone/menaquinone biosynthesis C-methylase UbiE
MNKQQGKKLEKILVNVGDLGFRRRVVKIVNGLDIRSGEKILDCGCGEGFYVMVLNQLFSEIEIVGLDHDARLLEKAEGWTGENRNVTWVLGDIYKIPFGDNYFNKIILSEVLEHLPDDLGALKEVKRVMKPGGILAITVPNHNYPFFWDPLNWTREHLGLGHFSPGSGFLGGIWAMHLRLYYPEEIKELVKRVGFKIEEIKGLTHYCIPFNHNILYLGKQFYTKLPVPKSVLRSMEKFEWSNAGEKNEKDPLHFFLDLLKKIDQKNDDFSDLSKSSMCIFIKARKL